MHREEVTGFVLAGGKSTRMGSDKAVMQLEGRTLLEHALGVLRQVAGEVSILGPAHRYSGYGTPVIEDIFPGCGPLGGIHAALKKTKTELNLIIAVDTPFLSSEFLSFMLERAMDSGAVITTPEIAGYSQPLCSVYSREFLPIAEKALKRSGVQEHAKSAESHPELKHADATQTDNGSMNRIAVASYMGANKNKEFKIVPLFPLDRTCVITEAEMRRFAFEPDMFENLNTSDDLERARRREPK